MKSISGKKLCKILKSKDWALARITGSHHIFIKKGVNIRITVPVHKNKDLKIGLLRAIMKIAGLKESEL